MESVPSTSTASDVMFDDFIQHASRLPIDKLKEHLVLIEQDNHALLESVRDQIEKDRAIQINRIKCHRERAEQRAKEDFDHRESVYRQQTNTRINELLEECVRRIDDLERVYEYEYAALDITKMPSVPITYETNKKTLRGRGGGQLIEPVTYFNANQNNRIPEFRVEMGFNNDTVRRNVDIIMNRPETRRKPGPHSVSVHKPKLVIDSKSFKHGEDVYVSNKTFGSLLAKLEISNEKTIILKGNNESEQKCLMRIIMKGSNSWDPRQITATVEDLEDGRVMLTKQKEKDKNQ